MKIHRLQTPFNLLPLFYSARAREMRRRPTRAELALARRYGISLSAAGAIACANGHGPKEGE